MTIPNHLILHTGIAALVVVAAIFLGSPTTAHAALGDGASSNIRLLDTNANGEIDRITIDIANPNGETWALSGALPYDLAVTDDGLGVTISAVSIPGLATANPVVLRVDLNESDADLDVDTSASAVEIIYTAGPGSAIRDGVDEQLNAIATGDTGVTDTETDFAAPVLLPGTVSTTGYYDENSNGGVELIKLDYSEDVAITGTLSSSRFTWVSASGATGFGGTLSGNAAIVSGNVHLTITGVEANETGASTSPTVGYDDNSDDGVNNIKDSAGNIVQTHGAQSINDRAWPIVVGLNPANNGTLIPAVATVTITFSEDMQDATITTGNIAAIATSGSAIYDLSETSGVVTLDPTGASFSPGVSVTVTLHGINLRDMNSNRLQNLGTVIELEDSGFNELYVFSTLTPSSSGGGGGGGSPSTVPVVVDAVTVTSPNGGEALTGGASYTATWTSAGNINNVNLSYSLDGGATFVSIVSGTANDGSHVWSVPNIAAASVLLRVVGRDSGGATLATDLSNAAFSITQNAAMPVSQPTASSSAVQMRTQSGSLVEMATGVLFRGVTLPDVYRVNADGTRHVFPNEMTFFSWGYSFNDVVVVNDDQLRLLSLGARVTMKPGSYLVKIQSDPKVYEVGAGATLSHIPDEATAALRFGVGWAQNVRDIPVVFFGDYVVSG